MGGCLIQTLTRACGYRPEGLEEIRLLDWEDLEGFVFEGDGSSTTGLITEMKRKGRLIDVSTPETAKYSSSFQKGVYTHIVETFIPDLTGDMQATLNLAARRRYLVVFQTRTGHFFLFGWEAGAAVTYTNQTDGGIGSLVTIAADSIHPLFEITAQALHYWILDTGRWDMTKRWWNDEPWKWK